MMEKPGLVCHRASVYSCDTHQMNEVFRWWRDTYEPDLSPGTMIGLVALMLDYKLLILTDPATNTSYFIIPTSAPMPQMRVLVEAIAIGDHDQIRGTFNHLTRVLAEGRY